jgi:hypothetical protein
MPETVTVLAMVPWVVHLNVSQTLKLHLGRVLRYISSFMNALYLLLQ